MIDIQGGAGWGGEVNGKGMNMGMGIVWCRGDEMVHRRIKRLPNTPDQIRIPLPNPPTKKKKQEKEQGKARQQQTKPIPQPTTNNQPQPKHPGYRIQHPSSAIHIQTG